MKTTASALRQLPRVTTRSLCCVLIPVALATLLSGCTGFISREEQQVREDRKRRYLGQPLQHHKDEFELSEHEVALRMGIKATDPRPKKVDANEQFPGSPGAPYGVLPAGYAPQAYPPSGYSPVDHASYESYGPDPQR